MKIFLDSANIEEIKEAHALGLIDGVTTNPSLIAKEIKRTGLSPKNIWREISSIISGPISAEVLGNKCGQIIHEAEELVKISTNIVVKIPIMEEGLKATNILSSSGIKTNLTLCFSPLQALLCAKVGATYISPFVGRFDDISQEGMSLVGDIKQIYFNYQFKTQILVASVRHPLHVLYSARIGADCITIPFKVIRQLLNHPLTDNGIKKFFEDIKNASTDTHILDNET